MDYGLLGPLRLEVGTTSCVPTAPKARHLLALLMINANQVVPVDTCIEELWQGNPPRSAVSTLQTYVLYLRRLLRAVPVSGQEVVATHNKAYRMTIPTGRFDRSRFGELVSGGRAACAGGDDEAAVAAYDKALALWRGPALCEVPDGPVVVAQRAGLEEERIGVIEQRVEAALRLGRHQELLGELSSFASAHPTHENVQAQLMVALYRTGRQAEALSVFHRLWDVLRTDLGLDPTPRMQRLHEAVLDADPALDLKSGWVLSGGSVAGHHAATAAGRHCLHGR